MLDAKILLCSETVECVMVIHFDLLEIQDNADMIFLFDVVVHFLEHNLILSKSLVNLHQLTHSFDASLVSFFLSHCEILRVLKSD